MDSQINNNCLSITYKISLNNISLINVDGGTLLLLALETIDSYCSLVNLISICFGNSIIIPI